MSLGTHVIHVVSLFPLSWSTQPTSLAKLNEIVQSRHFGVVDFSGAQAQIFSQASGTQWDAGEPGKKVP